MPKFKFVNGVMVKDEVVATATAVPIEHVPLAVICTPEELIETGVTVPQTTQQAFMECSDDAYMKKFNATQPIDESEILDRLSMLFAQYEVPVGLLHKLIQLKDYNIHIILDDSGSMASTTDSVIRQAGPFMAHEFKHLPPDSKMTRWQEQEDRLHIMVDYLSCIPSGPVLIRFMNRPDVILLEHNDTPEQWAAKAHAQIRRACFPGPTGGTPTYEKLSESFKQAKGKTIHYLFTDGVPNGGPERVAELILRRSNPEHNPVVLVSCTDKDEEAKWMKDIEEDSPFTSETDDYSDERDEVLHDQGPVFPYTKGLWLMSLLVGAINPYDLDALDDSRPLSRFTIVQLLGREITEQEYRKYWDAHPKHKEHEPRYRDLLTIPEYTVKILGAAPATAMARISARFKKFGF